MLCGSVLNKLINCSISPDVSVNTPVTHQYLWTDIGHKIDECEWQENEKTYLGQLNPCQNLNNPWKTVVLINKNKNIALKESCISQILGWQGIVVQFMWNLTVLLYKEPRDQKRLWFSVVCIFGLLQTPVMNLLRHTVVWIQRVTFLEYKEHQTPFGRVTGEQSVSVRWDKTSYVGTNIQHQLLSCLDK